MAVRSLALTGVVGGAGTTRFAVESAATLARAGRSVAVLDAAFATQGLATYVDGRIDPDVTKALVEEGDLSTALVDVEHPDLPGRLAVCPAHAPFERVARAKGPEAAKRFEAFVASAAEQFDHVLVDIPPVAANQAVAAVNAAERVVLVAPASKRGADLLPRMEGRLADLGVDPAAVVVTRADEAAPESTPLPGADYAIPAGDRDARTPTAADPDATLAPAVADAVTGLLETDLDLAFPSPGLF